MSPVPRGALVSEDKRCPACDQTLPLASFGRDIHTKTGLNAYCKPCVRQKKRVAYYRDHDAMTEKKRAWYHAMSPEAKAKMYKGIELARDQKKDAARRKLNQAVKRGEIARLPCHVCGSTVCIQAHHHDYSKPFDVEWMCSICHGKEHRDSPEGIAHARAYP